MGTSKSSSGSPSGTPFLPPWTPTLPKNLPQQGENVPQDQEFVPRPLQAPPKPLTSPLAPRGRFSSARRSLGKYAETGSSLYLRKGLGKYVKTGLGGKKMATKRFSGSVITARALNAALLSLSNNQRISDIHPLYPATISGQSVRRVIFSIMEAIRPFDGTQDTEASRESINEALSEILERYPDANLQKLSDEQRKVVIECYLAGDIIRRFELDVGGAIRAKAPNIPTALSRSQEIHDYIRATVSSALTESLFKDADISGIISSVIDEAMRVFEEYV